MMPFDTSFDEVYKTIKESIESAYPQGSCTCIRLDEIVTAGRITEDLVKEIQDATVCIADITGNNANVMWEVGYAMALEKPIIFISQSIDTTPFDVKDMRIIKYTKDTLPTSLRVPIEKSLRETIVRYNDDNFNSSRFSYYFERMGFRLHAQLLDEFIIKKFNKATDTIRIQQIWMTNFMSIRQAILDSAKRCKVKILLLDPRSIQTKYRSFDLGFHDPTLELQNSNYVKKLIESNMIPLDKLQSSEAANSNIEIRFYDATPVISIYGYDDRNILGIYWRKKGAVAGPQIEIKISSYFGKLSQDHFNDLWSDSISFNDVKNGMGK